MTKRWRELLWPEGAIWLALMALLALTLASSFVLTGARGTAANLAIAAAKVLLVVVYFMHLRTARGLDRLASTLGPLWLALLLALSIADFLAR